MLLHLGWVPCEQALRLGNRAKSRKDAAREKSKCKHDHHRHVVIVIWASETSAQKQF